MQRIIMTVLLAGLFCGCGLDDSPKQSGLFDPNAAGPKMVLVEQGVSRAPIVVFQDAPPFTINAAKELADYIEKASGVRPELLHGRPDPIPEHAIWVGYQPVLRDLFPGVDFDFKQPEEILIACDGKNLVIAGRDVWDPEHMVVPDKRGKDIVGKQQEYGTINAVYTFLQDCLGVRWLWPGELGEDVLHIPTIELPAFVYRYHPGIRARAGLFGFSALGNRGYGVSQDWSRKQRLQLGSLQIGGGHGFGSWWERFHETNPEYFALQPDGTRGGGETPYPSAHTVKMCESNPDLIRQWVDDIEEQLKVDPNLTVFNASPNDGWASGHCICDNCRAWDHPDNEQRGFSWKGFSSPYVAMTDRDVTFANACGKLLKERFPDKDYYVLMMSYGHSRPPPIEARPADNVIISSVANFLGRGDMKDRASSWGTTHREQYAQWAKIAPHLVWRPNTGSPVGWQQGQPDVAITKAIEDIKFVGENNCIGIFVDSVWEHWATQGPQYYVMAQLVWDPSKDGHAIMEDYYQRAYGKGAEALKTYWKLLEDKREEYFSADPVPDDQVWTQRPGTRSFAQVYDENFFKQAYALLDRGAAALAREPEIYAQRVGFTRAGLDYTRLNIELRGVMSRVRDSKGKAAASVARARAIWAEIEQLCKDNPYALNWGPIRPQTPRMRSLNPDTYVKDQ